MLETLYLNPILANCSFEKTATLPIIIFEILVLGASGAAIFFMSKMKDKIWLRFLVMAVGVLIFEMFTSPMWKNQRMGVWAYLYHDVSWILTIGWTALILGTVIGVDRFFSQWKEYQRFPVYLGILVVTVTILEIIVVNLGIRSYAPEVLRDVRGIFIAGVPILEVFYYTPVFTGLAISFYKYWSFVIDDEPLIPTKYRHWLRSIAIAFLGVFLFEVMIQPMVNNVNFPSWSYIFFDISILLIAMWVLIIGVAAVVVELFFPDFPILYRFGIALGITGGIVLPVESWLINHGYRVYGESAVANFIGFKLASTGIPIEIFFAIPCYLALIIAFIRYWETILDNRL